MLPLPTARLTATLLPLAALLTLNPPAYPPAHAQSAAAPHSVRHSPLHLELAGDLAGRPSGSTRYRTREDLLALPQMTYAASDDATLAALTTYFHIFSPQETP